MGEALHAWVRGFMGNPCTFLSVKSFFKSPLVYFALWMGQPCMIFNIVLIIWKILVQSYAHLPNVAVFQWRMWRTHLLTTTSILSEKSSGIGKLSSYDVKYKFPEFWFFAWKLECFHFGNKFVSCFPWSDRLTWFFRKCLPKTKSELPLFVCQAFFQVQVVSYENKGPFGLAGQSYKCLPSRQPSSAVCSTLPVLSHRIWKRRACRVEILFFFL